MKLVKKIFGQVLQSHTIVVKVVRYRLVDVEGVELQVDLAVDGSFQVLVVVLVHLQGGCGCHDGQLRRFSFAALEQWREPWGQLRVL